MWKRETITRSVYTVGLTLHTQTQTLTVVCIRSICHFFREEGTKQLCNQNIKHNHHLTLFCFPVREKTGSVRPSARLGGDTLTPVTKSKLSIRHSDYLL